MVVSLGRVEAARAIDQALAVEERPHPVRGIRELAEGRPLHDGEVPWLLCEPPVNRGRVAPADHAVLEREGKVFHEQIGRASCRERV